MRASERPLDRRELIKRCAQLGVLALSATTLERCGSGPSTVTTTTGPATSADWAALASRLTGRLVVPGSAGYGVDSLLYNGKFTNLHPRAIAHCVSDDDVARCVAFARRHGLDLAARSGGHSYGGYSSCDGLVIDVTALARVVVDRHSMTATVGAGTRLIDLYDAVGTQGFLVPGGSCPTVGIAGLSLGGGQGVFARKFGLTSDNMRSARLVSADSRQIRADDESHSDLLWACRGGGGGNFGVATEFVFDIHPLPTVTLFSLQYPWAAAAEVLSGWHQWLVSSPNELWSNCLLLSQGSSGFLAQVSGVFCGSSAQLGGLISRLRSHVGSAPSSTFVGTDDYLTAMSIEAGCSGLSLAACHLSTQFPGGRLGREAYSAKSSFLEATVSSSQIAELVGAVAKLAQMAPDLGGGLAFDGCGGAINDVASAATAYVHRDKVACIQASYSWSDYSSLTERLAGRQWLDWLGRAVFDPAAGAYQNYIDPTLSSWEDAYYGSNLERLRQVKGSYDPDDLFSFAQSIPLPS